MIILPIAPPSGLLVYSIQFPEILYPMMPGTVKALPRDAGVLSVVEIEEGFAYD